MIAVRPTCSAMRLCVLDPAPIFENLSLHPNGAVSEFILSLKPEAGIIKKVKCTLVQALRLCTGRTAHRGSRGIALIFLDHGTRRG
jgi:hypothetical protein